MAATLQSADSPASTQAAELAAVLHGAAIAPLTDRASLRVTGPDAPRWLNGMVTNDIQSLQPGEGNYNFLLNAQGRILGDCTVFRDSTAGNPAFFLETDKNQVDTIHQHLDKFIIMDDVELVDISEAHHVIVLAGPHAESLLRKIAFAIEPSQNLSLLESTHVMHVEHARLVPRIELWSDQATIQKLTSAFLIVGAVPVSPETLEHLRILSGTPRYGTDIRNTATAHDLPQETAQTRALHFSKGCYMGQEIVERIRSRGNVHRTFSGFQLTGTLPTPGTILGAESKPVGELTSVAAIPLATGTVQLALGYVRREALDRKQPLEYPGGIATPVALPYAIP
jgi:folate-binding protein YgfZ